MTLSSSSFWYTLRTAFELQDEFESRLLAFWGQVPFGEKVPVPNSILAPG